MAHASQNVLGDFMRARAGSGANAIELLQSGHREIEQAFEQFQQPADASRRQELVTCLCRALEVQMRIEEEIFYPAVLEATGNELLHDAAIVEHARTRELVRRILVSPGLPCDRYLAAQVATLAGLVQHRVEEEEKPGGLFDVAVLAGLDLEALGGRIERRRTALLYDDYGPQ